jgi:hypothetical protein
VAPADGPAYVALPEVAGASRPRLLAADDAGHADRVLVALDGAPGAGFAALWIDGRHGVPTTYLRCFDAAGVPRGDERPLRDRSSPITEVAASVALGGGGQGLACWQLAGGALGEGRFQVRPFGPDGAFTAAAELIRSGEGEVEPGAAELWPQPLVDGDGRAFVAWAHGGRPRALLPDGEQRLLDPAGPPAEGAIAWIAESGGAELAVWNAGSEIRSLALTPGARPVGCGGGSLLAAARDPRPAGGAWLLVAVGERTSLRPLDVRGRVAGEDVPLLEGAPPEHVDLGAWSEGLALLVQDRAGFPEAGVPGGAFELRFLSADGGPSPREPVALGGTADVRAFAPRVAGAGDRLLVAWSERREGGIDVLGRLWVAGEPEPGPELVLAGARATAHQTRPAAASVADQRAIAIWLDARGGHPLPYARLVTRSGDPMGAELPIPCDAEGRRLDRGPAAEPRAAMGPGGEFLAAWLEPAGLACQAFARDARPAGVHGLVTTGPLREAGYALTRQERFRSWLVAWSEPSGLLVRRVRGDGVPLMEATRVGSGPSAARAAVLELEDGRVVVAWDEAQAGGSRLRLRLLQPELHAATEIQEVPVPPRGSHTGPKLAPAPGGGFLIAWTAELSPSETLIAAREFGADAEPVGELCPLSDPAGREGGLCLAASSDGSWLVGFTVEQLLGPRIAVRRLVPGASAAGALHWLDPSVSGYRVGSQNPALVGVEGGWLGFWEDPHRGQGQDVWFRQVGLDFERDL